MSQSKLYSSNNVDIKEVLLPYTRNWKWFGFSVIIAMAVVVIYLRYAKEQYAVEAKIQILLDQNAVSELGAFQDLGILTSGSNVQVEDEIELLNSRSNLLEVSRRLGLNTRVMALGRVQDTELYENPPFKVNFLSPDSLVQRVQKDIWIQIISETSFLLAEDDESAPQKQFDFGQTISTEQVDFILIPNREEMQSVIGEDFKVSVIPISLISKVYQDKIKVAIAREFSNIITLSLDDVVPQRAIDILNSMINLYNKNDIENKRAIADRTSDFINERIADIYGELSTVDESAEEFKSSRGITDIGSQSNLNLNIGATSRQELQNVEVQLNIAESIKAEIDNMSGFALLPANVADGNIASAVSQYNNLVFERDNLLRSSGERNPTVVNLNTQLGQLRTSLQSSLERNINNLRLQVNNLSGQLSRINSQIYTAPRNERALRDIARQQQTTEALYLYLLQKREESQITFASASPKSKNIESAYLISPMPVSPKKAFIYLVSLIFGLLVPFLIIYARELLDNKVHNKVGLEKVVGDTPVLAEIPRLNRKESNLVKSGDRTVLAESLRILRTNLDYLINSKGPRNGGNIVFVTSSVPGEGKTLMSSNLAMIYAKANKKVLLLGADIRNPKLNQYYSGKNSDRIGRTLRKSPTEGLTDYLVNNELTVRDITASMLVSDQMVDVIYSGKLMPNPAELLMSHRMEELFEELRKHYEYIIVDTAPLLVVSDTQLISRYADQILYVTRANVTELKVLEFPLKLYKEGKLKNLSFAVNGVKGTNLGYGGRYGYGYGKAAKKWWKPA